MPWLSFRRLLTALLAVLVLAPAPASGRSPDVAVFLLDSPVDSAFLRGEVLERKPGDVSHGSLVARVLTRYCSADIVALEVEGRGGSADREDYLRALGQVVRTVESSPGLRAVVNISLASPDPDPREAELVQRLCDTGAMVVAAAGNDGDDCPMYPAALDGVVAVAAATREGKWASSSFGPHIDLCASGDITFIDYDFVPYERLRSEMEARGTSFAAPRVAATAAFILEHAPGAGTGDALDIMLRATVPIDDDLYRRGLLGAGILDVSQARTAVAPAYGFVQYTLPWLVCGALVALSGYLCLRHGSIGVFLSLLLWLVGLPLAFLLVLGVSDSLRFLGGGSSAAGSISVLLLALGVVAAALIQGRQLAKGLGAAAPALIALTLLLALGAPPPGAAVASAAAAGLVSAGLAGAWERRTTRLLRAIGHGDMDHSRMVAIYARALDARVRCAICAEMASRGSVEAAGFFLSHVTDRPRAVEGLSGIAARQLGALLPWVGRLGTLTARQRRLLLLALERGAPARAAAPLADLADQDPSGRIARLAARLSTRRDGA